MAFNRFRVYDILQKSISTILFGTTVVGTVFISANVYNNWVEKKKLQELQYERMTKDDPLNNNNASDSSRQE